MARASVRECERMVLISLWTLATFWSGVQVAEATAEQKASVAKMKGTIVNDNSAGFLVQRMDAAGHRAEEGC